MSQIKDINLQNNSRSFKQSNSIQVDKQQSTKQVQQILLQQQQTEKDSYRQKNQYSYQNSVYQKQLPKQYNFISNDSHNNINSRIQSNQPSHLGSNYSHQNYFSNEISEMMEDENEYLNGIEQNPSFVEKIQQKYLQNDSYQIPNQE
ncbi:hypothetical protein PPERSA_11950 [Pseudocohnilembus persalinus]|uniref:Uncharacterized protein n=1 Tax=Pseudocohnilembus persalinus TaxID=266149 RepID=A0A0V0QKA5_PSEPJ|nr:hypothetical protein PPERSA_11950 [Pseudocohnilembus persalinus]|eukprot:KRX02610.1 hypothetical protein PPERSA_11950 [Pseudocohnilembus persalinus]